MIHPWNCEAITQSNTDHWTDFVFWKSAKTCDAGQFLDDDHDCSPCPENTFSGEGNILKLHPKIQQDSLSSYREILTILNKNRTNKIKFRLFGAIFS